MILALQIISIVAVIAGLTGTYLYQSLPLIPWISGGIALVALIGYLWLDRRRLKVAVTHRSTLHGLNAGLKALLVLAIAVVVNMIFVNYDWKWDATKNKLHTLSEQSIKVVKDLQHPVTFRAFVNTQTMQDFKEVFDRYRYVSDKVKIEFMDVLRDPRAAEAYKITQLDTILVETENRTARVEGLANGPLDPKIEEKLTNAIIQANKGTKRKAYFLAGHGERSITDARQGSFTEIKGIMQEGRFEVAELKLVTSEKIPDDAEVVVIAGPKSEFMPYELKALEEFLTQRSGSVLVMVEPDSPASLQPWLEKFGVSWKPKKAVLELNELRRSANSNPVVPFIETYSRTHPITKSAQMPTILQLATPLAKSEDAPDGYKVDELFSTSAVSFEVAFQGQRLAVNEKTDKKGPLQIAYAVTGKSAAANTAKPPVGSEKADEKKEAPAVPEFRLVVVGDADFAANGIRSFGMNSDLYMNMLSWLTSEEDLIAIRPRATDDAKMDLTEFKVRVVQLASMIFAPLGLFAAALGVFLFRRRR
jgi:ABC-type uncharacterized transport system involved in gliding motility auxiliary subunit